MSFVASVLLLTVVYVFVGRLERAPALRFRPLLSPRPYLATDLAWYGVAIAATALSVFVFRPVLRYLSIGPVRDAIAGAPFLVKLLIGVLVFDFVSFVVHRALHRYDRLWNLHKVHHSTLQLDGFATTRTHMIENMVRFVPPQALLFLIGMPVSVVAASVATAAIYGVSNHSNLGINLRWLEPVLVTPRLHRRHHVPSTTQTNYGGIFTIWDRLFGTLLRADTAPDERFGVPGEIDTYPQRFAAAFRQPLLDLRGAQAAAVTESTGAVRPHRQRPGARVGADDGRLGRRSSARTSSPSTIVSAYRDPDPRAAIPVDRVLDDEGVTDPYRWLRAIPDGCACAEERT